MPESDVWAAWVTGPRETEAPQTINAWAAWATAEQRKAEAEERRRQERERREAEERHRRQEREAEAQERAKEYTKRQEERKRKEAEAQKRAEELLMAVLTPEQKEDYKNNKCFYVESNGELFRINEGHAGNVEKVDPETKRVIESYCIHPNMYPGGGNKMPDEDAMVAQKLALDTDPEGFKKTANITRHRPYH